MPANLRSHALNSILTLPHYSRGPELSIDVLYVTRASICVELWPKQVLHIISVPMSYNSLIGKQIKCVFNDSGMLFNVFELFCL